MMFEILMLFAACWIVFKIAGLFFKVTWGLTKILASILFAIAVPAFIFCLMFAGGILLLIPTLLLAAAFGLLKLAL